MTSTAALARPAAGPASWVSISSSQYSRVHSHAARTD
ncbi:hypothetical protein FHS36_005222 [Streptomyces eurocidicus]|uniref:Uncharacterized protein n=1 Tax=Streptomyces eurocidicus TaxID=66423 RepID=A0A7W8BGY4_STREU|nr:hypothetical protein [Streptomyces eurocidicus]